MGTLSGGRICDMIISASLLDRGQLLMERLCSTRSKFFSLRVEPTLNGLHHPEKRVSQILSSFVKVAENLKVH